MIYAGIDIGGTKATIGLFDQNRKLLAVQKELIAQIEQPAAFFRHWFEKFCFKNNFSYVQIASCGVGIPGTVTPDGRKIRKIPNLSLLGEHFADEMEAELKMPVRLIQDSRAAAWGEYLCGGAQNAQTAVCVTLGTGIGTGIVINGAIYHGALGCAGELGHLPVVANGRKCGCGKYGCLEKYCAGSGLDWTARELLGPDKTARDLFQAAVQNEPFAKNALQQAIEWLGNAMVALINLLSPNCLLFSGGLSAQEALYLQPLIAYIRTHCYSTGTLPVLGKAWLGEYAPLYGAAFLPTPEPFDPKNQLASLKG